MTKASDYQPPFASFGEQTIGAHTVKTGTTNAGKVWFYHAPCAHWFPLFDTRGDCAGAWLNHPCEGITPASLLHPDWLTLAAQVRTQSARLAAGK